jgi:hypothetical protein
MNGRADIAFEHLAKMSQSRCWLKGQRSIQLPHTNPG